METETYLEELFSIFHPILDHYLVATIVSTRESHQANTLRNRTADSVISREDMVSFVAPFSAHARPYQSCVSKLCPARKSPRSFQTGTLIRSAVCAKQSSGSSSRNDAFESWQESVRMLFDPSLNSSARKFLLQDLSKRFPESFNDFLQSPCVSRHKNGLADVFRQVVDDILPDLVSNGPRYASRATENMSRSGSNTTDSSRQTSQPPFPSPSLNMNDVSREFRNVFNRTPEGLYTPEYRVLLSGEGYQIRQYPSLIVAETSMVPSTEEGNPTEVESAAAMGQSFNNLAGYLFGKNSSNKEMKMTTPVVLSKGIPMQETMSFIIGEYKSVEDVPKSLGNSVSLREEPGKIYAVCEFSGFVTQGEAKRQRERLLSMLSRDKIQVTNLGKQTYKCMIYNGPSTLPNLRRNELLLEVVYDMTDQVDDTDKSNTYKSTS